jgi:CubicO group peptidase (beta-lactamase class C family)
LISLKNESVDFTLHENLDYNTSGYALGYIIELVSGNTYEDLLLKENIF